MATRRPNVDEKTGENRTRKPRRVDRTPLPPYPDDLARASGDSSLYRPVNPGFPGTQDEKQQAINAQMLAQIEQNKLRVAQQLSAEKAYTPRLPGLGNNPATQPAGRFLFNSGGAARLNLGLTRQQVNTARRTATALKEQYRKEGLYYGDLEGTYDPLLKNVQDAKFAKDEASQQAAIKALVEATKGSLDRRNIAALQGAEVVRRRLAQKGSVLQRLLDLKQGTLPPETEAFLRDLARMVDDPLSTSDPTKALALSSAANQLRVIEEQVEGSKPKGWAKVAATVLNAPGVKQVTRGLNTLFEEGVKQPLYAAQYASGRTSSPWEAAFSGLGNFPGLGFVAGDTRARRWAEAVNTEEERRVLTERGQLRSFGQRAVGHSRFAKDHPLLTSGLVDAAFNVFGDPLNYATGGLGKLGELGVVIGDDAARAVAREAGEGLLKTGLSDARSISDRFAARAASGLEGRAAESAAAEARRVVANAVQLSRTNFITNTARGKQLYEAVGKVLEGTKGFDAQSLRKAIPGLDEVVAENMARAGSKEAALQEFVRAFSTGEFSPTISLRRQLFGKFSDKALSAPGGIGLGKSVVRESEGLFNFVGKARNIRRLADDGVRATGRNTKAAAALEHTIRAGLTIGRARFDDVYAAIADSVIGLPVEDRLSNIWEKLSGDAALEDLFERNLQRAEKRGLQELGIAKPTLRDIEKVGTSKPFENFLKQMEVLAALAGGEAGDLAAKQVKAEAKFGLSRTAKSDSALIKEALGNSTKAPLHDVKLANDLEAQYLRTRIIEQLTDEDAKELLLRELDRVSTQKGHAGLAKLERKIETLARDATDSELGRLARSQAELVGLSQDPVAVQRRLIHPLQRLTNSMTESVAPRTVAFLGYSNAAEAVKARVRSVDRWMAALGMDDFFRTVQRQSLAAVKAEDDLFRIVDNVLVEVAQRNGIDPDVLRLINQDLRNEVKEGNRKVTFESIVEDGTIKLHDEVHTLAQRGEVIYLPDPDDVRRAIREAIAQKGDLAGWEKFRHGLSKAADTKVFGIKGPIKGEELTARSLALSIHRKWKMLTVIPGADIAVLGAVGGFALTDGDTGDKLKGAAQGASLGLLSPMRYMLRVAGIEEGGRKWLAQGFNVEAWKPHLSEFATKYGLDRPFTSFGAVRAGDPIGSRYHSILETTSRGWEAIEPAKNPVAKLFRKDSRYLDAYSRIVNFQAHPESDFVAKMFLEMHSGERDLASLVEDFGVYMKTEDGKLWLRRLKGGFGGPADDAEALMRYQEFFGRYFADPEVARARLDAARQYAVDGVKHDIDPAVIKQAARAGTLPEFVHAPKSFVIPKNFKEAAALRDRLTSQFVFEGPTTAFNRAPMAKSIYRDEYLRLLRDGVDGRRAQEVAEQIAVEKTNRIMFRIDDESRFAAKVDPFFPFQQPREEMFRVWAPLIAENPVRVIQATRLGALAFNNGKEKGTFYQDRYGNWRMVIPGSGFLSKLLFNSSSAFDFQLDNLLFFGQGAYDIGIVPSFGGPFYSVGSRLFLNRFPGILDHMPDKVQEWFLPYGASGRLFRPEVSRMWQAWTGEPAPFEFASRFEQMDALNRHRQDIFLQLKWQHGQKTGDWDWNPSDDEVDKAVSASLKAWAFFGSYFPSSPGFLRPDQQAVDAIKAQFTDPNGEFDYYGFVDKYPQFAPWLKGRTETIDDSFDSWARTQGDDKNAKLKHEYRTKDFAKWRAELDEAAAESKAYKERADIYLLPDHLQQDAYQAWELKHPDLAARSHTDYERDIELMRIEGTLVGSAKDAALDTWRRRYDVSFPQYQTLVGKLRQGKLRSDFDPWENARPSEMVYKDVQKVLRSYHFKSGDFEREFAAERNEVAKLSVAEQIKYWQWRLNHMDYDATDDPDKVLDRYYTIKNHVSGLYKTPPMQVARDLKEKKYESAWAKQAAAKSESYRSQIADISHQIETLSKQMDAAYDSKSWSTYNALKKKREALYDLKEELQNEWYRSIPDTEGLLDDVKATVFLSIRGRTDLVAMIRKYRVEHPYFIPTDQEASYLSMNSDVRQAYIDDLVNALSGKKLNQYGTITNLKWEYLTDFQKDLLEKNLPRDVFEDLRDGAGAEHGGRGFGRGYGPRTIGQSELGWAYAMFKQYNKRGGAKPPAAYQEYLELPNDAALRSAFLKKNPEVQEYIKLGPMANMPPVIAMMVADIMIRNGKWEGEPRSITEISEIAFAREQMARWNRRGDRTAPEAYTLWVNMPTGVEKAQYLKAHPEIGEWLQLGPMANMPEAYREVVRDIMYRYGEWTNDQDALGEVITGYYRTPSYARDAYLEQHPELVEYWKAIRTPEEQAKFDLADRYFSIQDPQDRRFFLQVHPELQQWFLDQRQRRYENFLNQVAIYMGSSPELFEKYLQRQEDILGELLHKFSSAPLMRERYFVRAAPAARRARTRQAA